MSIQRHVIEWKWKLDIQEVFEQSPRPNDNDEKQLDNMNPNIHINANINANNSSDTYKNMFNDTKFNEQFTRAYDSSKKFMNESDMNRMKIVQTNINPFLRNNNYLSDIANEDKFLRPKSSTINNETSSSSQ
jgi:hypothetical protein